MTKRARLKTETNQPGAQRLVVRLGCCHNDVQDIPPAQARDGAAPHMLDAISSGHPVPQKRRHLLEDERQIDIVRMVLGLGRRRVELADFDHDRRRADRPVPRIAKNGLTGCACCTTAAA